MVARLDQPERKQFRVVDQLDPDGRQDDGGTELAVQALLREAFCWSESRAPPCQKDVPEMAENRKSAHLGDDTLQSERSEISLLLLVPRQSAPAERTCRPRLALANPSAAMPFAFDQDASVRYLQQVGKQCQPARNPVLTTVYSLGNARVSAKVRAQRRRHRQQRHDKGRRHEPPPLLRSDPVPYPTEGRPEEERDERSEGLLVALVEGAIGRGE